MVPRAWVVRVVAVALVVAVVVTGACARCGDGVVSPVEVCDDGNRVGGDGCSSVCLAIEYGFTCPPAGGACTRVFTCGNGTVEPGEVCDDGNTVGGDGCSRTCRVEPEFVCSGGNNATASVCVAGAACGDGYVDTVRGEVCDTGSAPTLGCEACTSVTDGFACFGGGMACRQRNCTMAPQPPEGQTPPAAMVLDDGSEVYPPDCAGTCGGFAYIDDCGVCAAGNTGVIPNSAKDDCGVCFGENLDKDTCNVCFGGNAGVDACGVCYGTNSTCTGCDGVLHSGKVSDVCGICDGDGSECMGCDGVHIPLGGKLYDACGVCGGGALAGPCLMGCDGVIGSNKTYDCAGVCGGSGVVDDCGVCIHSGSSVVFNYHKTNPCDTCFGDQLGSLPTASAPASACGIGCPGDVCDGQPLDACGVYDGDGSTCRSTCGANNFVHAVVAATKNYDACGVCQGDGSTCSDDFDCYNTTNAGGAAVRFDCRGVCANVGDPHAVDACGACSKTTQLQRFLLATAPVVCGCFVGKDDLDPCGSCPGSGSGSLDECNVCSGGQKGIDRCGMCFGNGQLEDACGTCNGTNLCIGCDGVPDSGRVFDACGVCGGDSSSCASSVSATSERFGVLIIMGGGSLLLLCCVAIIGFFVYRHRQRSFVSKYEKQRAAELGNHPTGEVTIVFTDIEGSTSLWENYPAIMPSTIETHHAICRRVIMENNGYEVKTEGDAFMIAFHQPIDAVRFAAKTQMLLLKQKWPSQIMAHPLCAIEKDSSGKVHFRGLRVRMGIHTGYPSCRKDENTGIMDYFGSMVNRAARVEHAASGGQILTSARTYEACRTILDSPKSPFVTVSLGEKHFKGIKGRMSIYQIMPKQLATRTFKDVISYQEKTTAGDPARGIAIHDLAAESSSSSDEGFDAFRVGASRAGAAFQAGW